MNQRDAQHVEGGKSLNGVRHSVERVAALNTDESGVLAGWIAQLPCDIGEKGVTTALKLLKGETVPATLYTDVVVVTKENLKSPQVQALLKL